MHPLRLIAAAAIVLLASAGAFAQSKAVTVDDAWVRVYEGAVTAYFHIVNNAKEPERLISVSTPVAGRAQLTSTRVLSGKFSFLPLAALEIDGFEEARLRPGATHVRLTDLTRELRVGDVVPLTLRFERSGNIEVTARVSNQLLGNR